MLTLTDFATRKNLSRTRIHQLLKAGRIRGAKLIGNRKRRGTWVIPPDAVILPPII